MIAVCVAGRALSQHVYMPPQWPHFWKAIYPQASDCIQIYAMSLWHDIDKEGGGVCLGQANLSYIISTLEAGGWHVGTDAKQ